MTQTQATAPTFTGYLVSGSDKSDWLACYGPAEDSHMLTAERHPEFTRRPLKPAAAALLASLPRDIRTCEASYGVALALKDEGLVILTDRAALGNGQVRYTVRPAVNVVTLAEVRS